MAGAGVEAEDPAVAMDITDTTTVEGPATLVVGGFEGNLPTEPGYGDLHIREYLVRLESVRVEYQASAGGEVAMTILNWTQDDGLPPGSVLASPCSDHLH